jgi:hypothetical protein
VGFKRIISYFQHGLKPKLGQELGWHSWLTSPQLGFWKNLG